MDSRESGRTAGYRSEVGCGVGVEGQGRPAGAGGGGMPAAAGEGADAYGYASAVFEAGGEELVQSLRKLLTGLAMAALIARIPTVSRAVPTATTAAAAYIQPL